MTQAGQEGGTGAPAGTETGQQQQQAVATGEQFAPITSQDEFDKRLSARLERERAKYADYDDMKKQLADIENANKSEVQKATDAADAKAKELGEAVAKNARLEAAIKHGLSEEDVAALDGVPADKVDALAQRLAAGGKKTTRASAAGLQSGAGNGQQQLTGKERAAASLRDLRRQ